MKEPRSAACAEALAGLQNRSEATEIATTKILVFRIGIYSFLQLLLSNDQASAAAA